MAPIWQGMPEVPQRLFTARPAAVEAEEIADAGEKARFLLLRVLWLWSGFYLHQLFIARGKYVCEHLSQLWARLYNVFKALFIKPVALRIGASSDCGSARLT
ncbi:MAG: hypothetical protein IT466_08805, partial [Moraxellaceae bacterium]|nr:hypothetical protein [Moraxellaceae bacterium]